MKKGIIIALCAVLLLTAALVVYPHIEFKSGDKFIALRYSGDIEQFEDELSPDECYAYYKKADISVNNYDVKKFLFFYLIKMDFVEGNYADSMYYLGEEYMEAFLERAEITENALGIDVAALIEGKTALPGSRKYPGNEYDREIYYTLDGEESVMFVYECDGMICFQIGLSDEGPRYIAYK